ncbi:hypothetical protein [Arthrobacter sp. GCM10027362]|uniref:hypothetical protein n=1 Tax=Arthrobacter sp. GCM10027362 TaxID=3273379 RepID=UPI0036721285
MIEIACEILSLLFHVMTNLADFTEAWDEAKEVVEYLERFSRKPVSSLNRQGGVRRRWDAVSNFVDTYLLRALVFVLYIPIYFEDSLAFVGLM